MRLVIAAVGRLKDGAERQLVERYRERFAGMAKRLGFNPVVWHELAESRAATAPKRMAEEGAALGNPRAKMLVHLLAEAAMKCVGSASEERATSGGSSQPTRARSPYRDVYEQGRATYATREGWTPARQHAAALRLVGKEILRDLWVVSG